MYRSLKHLVKESLKQFIIRITGYSNLQQCGAESIGNDNIDVFFELPFQHSIRLMKALRNSRSQLGQDLFVLSELNFKRNGFFVEFGAANGVDLSNTSILERHFGWNGILAEPAKRWHKELKCNRNCYIETDCIWQESNSTLTFNEVELSEYSTIDSFSSSDTYNEIRKQGKTYKVNTISLEGLLDKYNAPKKIDYLSIDTEGSEYEILKNLDFDKYQFRIITCEHNFTPQREKIFSLLTENYYVRKYEKVSRYDDWYVRADWS